MSICSLYVWCNSVNIVFSSQSNYEKNWFESGMKKNCDCEVAWQSIDMGLNASVPTPICIWTSSSVKSTLSTLIFTHDCDIHSVLTPIMLCHMLLLLCAVK